MPKLKNPLISFLQNLLFRKCQSPLPLTFAFLFSIRTLADKMSVLKYKKRGNNFEKHRKPHIAQWFLALLHGAKFFIRW